MRSSILYFILLMLGIPFNFGPDTSHKQGRFFNTLWKEDFEFIPSREDGIIVFELGLMLLLVEIDFVVEKQSRKMNKFKACSTGRIKMIFALPTEVVALHI